MTTNRPIKFVSNKEVGSYSGMAKFYLEKNGGRNPRWKYMNKERMRFIFTECIRHIKDVDLTRQLVEALTEMQQKNEQ
jgi:hypothetical protein